MSTRKALDAGTRTSYVRGVARLALSVLVASGLSACFLTDTPTAPQVCADPVTVVGTGPAVAEGYTATAQACFP